MLESVVINARMVGRDGHVKHNTRRNPRERYAAPVKSHTTKDSLQQCQISSENVIGMARRGEAEFDQTASSASPSPTCSSSSIPNQGNGCFTNDHKNLSEDSAEPKHTSPAGDSAKTQHSRSHNTRRRPCEDSAEP
jgi:hypothetical protein